MRGVGAGEILASKNPAFKVGDWATAFMGWKEIAKVGPSQVYQAPRLPGIEKPDLLGVLGMTGLTAYFGLEKIGQPKEGDLVVISGAAGATGSIVGQICKLKGCRVVGIAGSSDKCAWLKDIGFDVALNYKDADFKQQFLEATKDKIDVYWDNGKLETWLPIPRQCLERTCADPKYSWRRDPRPCPWPGQAPWSYREVWVDQRVQLGRRCGFRDFRSENPSKTF